MVNAGKPPVSGAHRAGRIPATEPATAQVTVLTGEWDGINTPEDPEHIKPAESEWRPEFAAGSAGYTFAPRSFTVLSFR